MRLMLASPLREAGEARQRETGEGVHRAPVYALTPTLSQRERALATQVHLPHSLISQELAPFALILIASQLEDIAATGDVQRAGGVLLDEEDRQSLLLQRPDLIEDLVHQPGG